MAYQAPIEGGQEPALKEIIAGQVTDAMKARGIAKTAMLVRMSTD